MGLRYEETDCRKCCVSDFKNALCEKDFCEKYYREGSAEVFEKLLPHWIPCSERLPEDDVYVLISKRPNLLSGKKWCVTIAGRFKGARNNLVEWKDIGFGKLQDDEILAWMPLPELYQEGTDD